MKRLFAAVLAAALLCTAGCKAPAPTLQEPDYTAANTVNGETYTDCPGISVQINALAFRDGKSELSVVWSNRTQQTVTYGEGYTIERLEGETWVSCAKREDLVFVAIGYTLEADRLKNKTYDLTELFDVSKPGTYRFRTSCTVQTDAGKNETCRLWAEFTLNSG